MGSWILYVDESGPFERGELTGILGGVLLDVSTKVIDVGTLKAALLKCYPLMPWPLHATYTRQPLAHVAAAMISGQTAPALASELLEVRQLVAAATSLDLAAFREIVQRQKMPEQELLVRAFAELGALDQHLALQLLNYTDARFTVSRKLMQDLASTLDGRVFAVAAASAPKQGYPNAFKRCVYRALQFLRRRAGPQDSLRLTVAARKKVTGEYATTEDLLAWAADGAAVSESPLVSPTPDVVVSADPPKHMDAKVSPWLVVADFVCNRLVNPVRDTANWAELEKLGRERLGLSLRMPAQRLKGHLPTLAYEKGEDSQTPGWAKDQALQWDAAVLETP